MYNNNTPDFGNFPNSFEQRMAIPNVLYDQTILKPPRQNVTHSRIASRLTIDSTLRDKLRYPDPANYVYEVDYEWRDLISVKLIKATLPNTSYIIDNTTNTLIFREFSSGGACGTGENICIHIRPGDYGICSLTAAISKAMTCASSLGINYQSTVDQLEGKIVIASDFGVTGATGDAPDTIFSLIFQDCCETNCNCNCYYGDAISGFMSGDLIVLPPAKQCENQPEGKIYQTNRRDPKCIRANYPKNSIGEKIGFDSKNVCLSTGTVTSFSPVPQEICCNADDGASVGLIGTGTKFLSEVYISQDINTYVLIDGVAYKVREVCSDTELTLYTTVDPGIVDRPFISGTKKGQFKYDLSSDQYVILSIRELDSLNGPLPSTFAVIPLYFPHNTKNFAVLGNMGNGEEIRYFNPPNPRLNKLTIQFKKRDGTLFNFNGLNHMFELEITTMNQPGKYNF